MCLILIAHQRHPRYRLVVAANRDEFFRRPTASADYWADAPHVLGGRDLDKGGTWMAVARDGRWAAVTNFREGTAPAPGTRSRGELVANFLENEPMPPRIYLSSVRRIAHEFSGFNLLFGNQHELHYLSNKLPDEGVRPTPLMPELYGLSNGFLNTPWPKVEHGKLMLQTALAAATSPDRLTETLLAALSDRRTAEDEVLPNTGVSSEWEKRLSAAFIGAPGYGTRASTVLIMESDGEVHLRERSFGERGELLEDRRFRFTAVQPAVQHQSG